MKQCFIVQVARDNEKGGRWAMKGNSDDRKPLILKIFYLMTIQTFHSILSGASAGTLTKKKMHEEKMLQFLWHTKWQFETHKKIQIILIKRGRIAQVTLFLIEQIFFMIFDSILRMSFLFCYIIM